MLAVEMRRCYLAESLHSLKERRRVDCIIVTVFLTRELKTDEELPSPYAKDKLVHKACAEWGWENCVTIILPLDREEIFFYFTILVASFFCLLQDLLL